MTGAIFTASRVGSAGLALAAGLTLAFWVQAGHAQSFGTDPALSSSVQLAADDGAPTVDASQSTVQSLTESAQSAASGLAEAARSGAGALAGAISGATPTIPAMQLAATAPARPSPVVVELFTSQGCSACPPADELLASVAPRQDIIALALHVDYWDYLGWEDPFAQPAFTTRQKAYARVAGERMIYTPQMIIGGREALVGPSAEALDTVVKAQASAHSAVSMTISGGQGTFEINLAADPPLEQGTIVQIVRYVPQARVEILRGENAGLELDYANVVTAWHAVAEWDGKTPTKLTARIQGDEPAVVIVQTARPSKSAPLPGPILAAGRLE